MYLYKCSLKYYKKLQLNDLWEQNGRYFQYQPFDIEGTKENIIYQTNN